MWVWCNISFWVGGWVFGVGCGFTVICAWVVVLGLRVGCGVSLPSGFL